MFWVDNQSIGRMKDPFSPVSDLFNQSYDQGELELPTAQEFADFQATQRTLRNLGGEAALINEIGPTECSYFRLGIRNIKMSIHKLFNDIHIKVDGKTSQSI